MKELLLKTGLKCRAILHAVLQRLFRLAGKELTDAAFEQILQFLKFCIVGFSNTAVSLIVYYIVVFINKAWYLAGTVAGFILSVLNSYLLNSKFVFHKQDEKARTLLRSFLAYSSNLLLVTFMLWLLVDKLHLSPYLAPFVNMAVTVPLNFLLNKFWVMKKRPKKEDPS